MLFYHFHDKVNLWSSLFLFFSFTVNILNIVHSLLITIKNE